MTCIDLKKFWKCFGVIAIMKKLLYISICVFILAGCSEYDVEEFIFRTLVEYDLKEDCGDNDECKQVVTDQIKICMEQAGWRNILGNEEDEKVMQGFIEKFHPCFKYKNGNSLF